MRIGKWHRMSLPSSVTVSEWMTAAAGEEPSQSTGLIKGPSQIYAFCSLSLSLAHAGWRLNASGAQTQMLREKQFYAESPP